MSTNDKWFKRNRLLTVFAPIFIYGLGLALVQLDHTPDVKYIGERVRPGYETAAAYYQVEASSNKEWGDYWAGYWFMPVASFLLMAAVVFLYISYVENQVKQGSWVPIGIAWLCGALMILIPFWAITRGGSYETVLTPDQFDHVKNAIDAIFPIKK